MKRIVRNSPQCLNCRMGLETRRWYRSLLHKVNFTIKTVKLLVLYLPGFFSVGRAVFQIESQIVFTSADLCSTKFTSLSGHGGPKIVVWGTFTQHIVLVDIYYLWNNNSENFSFQGASFKFVCVIHIRVDIFKHNSFLTWIPRPYLTKQK